MAISPKGNVPYVAYGARGVDNKMSVAKFENGAWAQVGDALFSSIVNGSHYDFDVAPDGTPYVAYGDQDEVRRFAVELCQRSELLQGAGPVYRYGSP